MSERTADQRLAELRRIAVDGMGMCFTRLELIALVECAEALRLVKQIASEAHGYWDANLDSKVGKILIALAGHVPRYRSDIDKVHAALAKLEAL